MKKIIIRFFFIFCFTFGAGSAFGCVCVPNKGDIKKELREAGAVFSGKFVGTEYRKSGDSQVVTSSVETAGEESQAEILVLKFQVENWWKGKGTKEVVLVTDRTKSADGSETISSCDFQFEIGKRYLVYAFSDEKQLKTNVCTRTKEIGKAGKDLKILGKGRKQLKR